MNIIRQSKAVWQGDLTTGKGRIDFGSGAFSGSYTFKDRTENTAATNPEELIAAAHAGCFSMALSAELTKKNFKDIDIKTQADVTLSKNEYGFYVAGIHLQSHATVKGIDEHELQTVAINAKKNCPISKALSSIPISLTFNGIDL